MSKTIYLIRHAKAESNDDKDDYLRALSQRGIDDIRLMSSIFTKYNPRFDLIISSEAKRCKDTTIKLLKCLNIEQQIEFKKELYDTNVEFLLKFIKTIPNSVEHLAMVLHNPEITKICEYLSDVYIGNIPTCGIVALEFDKSWENLEEYNAKTIFFEYPKKYKKIKN